MDLNGASYPLKGRVQDCAVDGSLLAVATNSTVFWIDPADSAPHEVQSSGGDRVALGSGWIAWTQGERIHAKAIATNSPAATGRSSIRKLGFRPS